MYINMRIRYKKLEELYITYFFCAFRFLDKVDSGIINAALCDFLNVLFLKFIDHLHHDS